MVGGARGVTNRVVTRCFGCEVTIWYWRFVEIDTPAQRPIFVVTILRAETKDTGIVVIAWVCRSDAIVKLDDQLFVDTPESMVEIESKGQFIAVVVGDT